MKSLSAGKVSILLATYKPNMEYLKKLLQSLNNQSYQDLELICLDDSDDDEFFNKIKQLVQEEVTCFPYRLSQNQQNLGSNLTFELLTKEADGMYFAYCDQDDVWESNKIESLVKMMTGEVTIAYSDLSVINQDDHLIAKSFREINKRITHKSGDNLFEFFLRANCITGCTMLIRKEIAKSALPFCREYFVHDHWLSLCGSQLGTIAYSKEPLIRYRIHNNNQIGASVLKGLKNKSDYINLKLKVEKKKLEHLKTQDRFSNQNKHDIEVQLGRVMDRISFFESRSFIMLMRVLKNIRIDPQLTIFEVVLKYSPDFIAKRLIRKFQK